MKVTIKGLGDFEVKDLPYKTARQLHRKNSRVFWGKSEEDVNPDEYYDLLEEVRELSGLKDVELNKLTMLEVDQLLQQILMDYLGLNPKD
jgi:hypothetical protein